MLRNNYRSAELLQTKCKIIQKQHLTLCTSAWQSAAKNNNMGSNLNRQSKLMGKFFGNRVAGSKKRWYPMQETSSVSFNASQFGKPTKASGKNTLRRVTVLNKLFMKHITDYLATGEASESVLGCGLMITRVKTSADFAYINVYWHGNGDVMTEKQLEEELKRCSGVLRHELSQLALMGEVPRIRFVREKTYSNLQQVEALLQNMDFGADDGEQEEDNWQKSYEPYSMLKDEFFGSNNTIGIKKATAVSITEEPIVDTETATTATNVTKSITATQLPKMRHDVLGLDHSNIMSTILTKMRKSKQAWELHKQNEKAETTAETLDETKEVVKGPTQLERINQKMAAATEAAEEFDKFLAKRRERKATPERKKYYKTDDLNALDVNNSEEDNSALTKQQRQLYDEQDYIHEEQENGRKS